MLTKTIKLLLLLLVLSFSAASIAGKPSGGNNGGGNGNGNGNGINILENYNTGKIHGESFLRYERPEENYNAYLGLVIKNCAGLTNTSTGASVYAPGDPRLGSGLCAFTMGVKDGFYGKVSDLSICEKSNVQNRGFFGNSDQANQGNQSCLKSFIEYNDNPNVPIHFCPKKDFSDTVLSGTTKVTFKLPGGTYREGIMGFVQAEEAGTNCINENNVLECSASFRCQRKNSGVPLEWVLISNPQKDCTCVPLQEKSCLGDAPIGREYCKCGSWVNFQQYTSNAPCI